MELWAVCWGSTLQLRHSDQQLGFYPFQALTCSKLHDLDMRIQGSQMKLPRRVVKQKPGGEQGVSTCIVIQPNKAGDEQI